MEVPWRIRSRCKNVIMCNFDGIFGYAMTKISISEVTIRSHLGLSDGSPLDTLLASSQNTLYHPVLLLSQYIIYGGLIVSVKYDIQSGPSTVAGNEAVTESSATL